MLARVEILAGEQDPAMRQEAVDLIGFSAREARYRVQFFRVAFGLPGGAEMAVSDLLTLQKGSTVALNRRIGEPVDVMVNGRKIARGEITVLENDPGRFGVKLTEIITQAK